MTEGLPKGLITTSRAITEDFERVDRVAIEDITQLWRVYTTNRNTLADDVGCRLENFFWRIWSNDQIHCNITGSQVAFLFNNISEGDVIRTTPTQSPRSSRSLRILDRDYLTTRYQSSGLRDNSVSSDKVAVSQDREREALNAPPTYNIVFSAPQPSSQPQDKGKGRDTRRPPPILKNPTGGSSTQLNKAARIVTPAGTSKERADDEEHAISPTTSTSLADRVEYREQLSRQASPPLERVIGDQDDKVPLSMRKTSSTSRSPNGKSAKTQLGSINKPTKKKTAFLASTASTKRRPSIVRRKSSQSSSSNASKTASPRVPDQSITHRGSTPPLEQPFSSRHDSTQIAPRPDHHGGTVEHMGSSVASDSSAIAESSESSDLTSSLSSKPSRRASQEQSTTRLNDSRDSDDPAKPPQDWLVDKDFRTKFADKSRIEHHPFRGLHSIPPKSTAAVMAPASFQASGDIAFENQMPTIAMGKMKQADFTDKLVPLKPPGASSSAMDNDDSPPSALPKTKSQLTLLLDRDSRSEHEKKVKRGGNHGKRRS